MKRIPCRVFHLSLAGATALVLALAANGVLVLLLLHLTRIPLPDSGLARPRDAGLLEVALTPVETRPGVREPRIPRRSSPPRKQPLLVPSDPRNTPRAPDPPPLPRLSLAATLDLPELPRLRVDPAASLEDLDLNTLTAQASNPWPGQGTGPMLRTRTSPDREGNAEPREVFLPRPRFPGAAVRRNIRHAEVVVHFRVDRSGRVDAVHVVRAEPEGYFEGAVERALRKARFSPARRRNRPVDRWCLKTYTFVLEGK